MYCSACGQGVALGQPVCNRCGRPMMAIPPVPGIMIELESYAGKLKALSIVWFVYAGLSILLGGFALMFAQSIFAGHMGPWGNAPWAHPPFPPFMGQLLLKFVWFWLFVRVALALAAGWGLLHRSPWGRVVAIVSAFWNLLKFPFGTAIGIWTLVLLMGYRNSTLFNELPEV